MNSFNSNIVTNIDTNSREDYILFFTETNYKSNDIINYMHKKYNIDLLNIIIREEMNFSKNLPCEIILKINKN